jgi:hypothetical protein
LVVAFAFCTVTDKGKELLHTEYSER